MFAPVSDAQQILDVGSRKQLFLDDRVIEKLEVARGGIRTPASWKGIKDLSALAGQRIRLRFRYRNAKFYSFQFQPPS